MFLLNNNWTLNLKYFIIFFLWNNFIVAQPAPDSIIIELDRVMLETKRFGSEKEKRIDGLKSLLAYKKRNILDTEKYQINNKLIEEYWSYSFDSTITYINRNTKIAKLLNNNQWINKSKLDLALLLASSGTYKEAQDILGTIDKDGLTTSQLKEYYNCYRKMYSDLDYFSLEHDFKKEYLKLYKKYTDSIKPLISDDDDEYLYLQEWELLDQRRFDDCLKINSLRLSKVNIASKEYSYITFQRSMIYEQMNQFQMEKKYLALSAISDIMDSRKDNASLAKLAFHFYEKGDIERAYRYIKYSFEDATFYNSKLRFIEIANSFSLIMESHQEETDRKNRALLIFTVVVSLLSFILLALLYFVQKQKKKLQIAQSELHEINEQYKEVNISLANTMEELKLSYYGLSEANAIKELYIGSFMKIYSEFIDKLDKYRLTVNNMLRTKKHLQLFDMTKTSNAIEKEIELFYKTFDTTFLSLYPTFVDDLNNLLTYEERIQLKNNEILNTELRILAVIRLGINDSARIAQLLRYSVNTIYNYRAKVKNKAKNKVDFENQILKIGAYDGFRAK
jgi:DNA-binding CsgD family transcriptional regulator